MKKMKALSGKWIDKLAARSAARKRNMQRYLELRRLKRIRRKTVPAYTHCKNCGAELRGMYCHRCGQYALDINQPFWKYVLQYFENVYQFDGKVWVTLWMLVRRPGFLTTEFNAGKIASYVHPMRLLMFITVVFFIGFFAFLGDKIESGLPMQTETYDEALADMPKDSYDALVSGLAEDTDTVVAVIADSAVMAAYPELFRILEMAAPHGSAYNKWQHPDTMLVRMPSGLLSEYFVKAGKWRGVQLYDGIHLLSTRQTQGVLFKERVMGALSGYAPLVALLLTPVLAWLFMLSYRKRKMPYMSHFVFALHWSSFLFLLVTLYILLGEFWHYSGYPAWGFVLIMLVYTTIASHRVYAGTGWIKSFFKAFFVLFNYILIVLVVLGTLFGLLLYSQKQIIANIVNPM